MQINQKFKDDQDNQETPKIVKIILILVFSLVVISLAGGFYYFALKLSYLEVTTQKLSVKNAILHKKVSSSPAFVTKVFKYTFPTDINFLKTLKVKDGSCIKASLTQPFRKDAYICTDLINNYDPCFVSSDASKAICQMDPLISTDVFVMNLTKPLPAITLPSIIKDNWAWFLELEDGTKLSPYTTKQPVVDGENAFYGSSIANGERTVLIGDLNKGEIWTAKRKILTLGLDKKWTTKSTETVKIKSVWQ